MRPNNENIQNRFRWFCSILSRPRFEGFPHHVLTFSIYFCSLSFWLTLPRGVLSTYWCCPSRPCIDSMVLLACMYLALFLALSLFPGNSLVSSRCDPQYASFVALTVSNSLIFAPALLRTHSIVYFAVHVTRSIFLSHFIAKASRRVSLFSHVLRKYKNDQQSAGCKA